VSLTCTEKLCRTAKIDAYLVDTARCVIQAGHAFAPLLTDTALADAVNRAEVALGIEFGLWRPPLVGSAAVAPPKGLAGPLL
jgi:hypothetical protein